ncbi:MAG TPA: C39 family peptidase [Ilumatobacteraceae bacterium]|nr:C39 family peptidase [Ilumatobacteraceae bacterium]
MAELDPKEARQIAGVELNALALAGVLQLDLFAGGEVSAEATPIHDISGEVLFYRLAVVRRTQQIATVDIAAHAVLGDPLIAVSAGMAWNPEALLGEARQVAGRNKRLKVGEADEVRFVAYSYPKIAVQFLRGGEELAMLELFTWSVVPPAETKDRRPLQPESFERWSLVTEMPARARRTRAAAYAERLALHRQLNSDLVAYRIDPNRWADVFKISLVDTRQIAYSLRPGDHTPCYELRGQETNVWCVGASAQMLLDFYRYEYTQTRLAQELGLGTKANPNGLPYSQVGHVVTALEALTGNGLDVTMLTNPVFSKFRTEIQANRPLISFVPGHSRTVAGYTESFIAPIYSQPYRGLLVYDPWPPNAGVITKWENYATQTYQYAYTALVTKI